VAKRKEKLNKITEEENSLPEFFFTKRKTEFSIVKAKEEYRVLGVTSQRDPCWFKRIVQEN
jgi:hypothetical protein